MAKTTTAITKTKTAMTNTATAITHLSKTAITKTTTASITIAGENSKYQFNACLVRPI